eukprot:m51a1_g818 hypothetical protein (902) ;mRNA; f:693945-697177
MKRYTAAGSQLRSSPTKRPRLGDLTNIAPHNPFAKYFSAGAPPAAAPASPAAPPAHGPAPAPRTPPPRPALPSVYTPPPLPAARGAERRAGPDAEASTAIEAVVAGLGLPSVVAEAYRTRRKIRELYDWQAECLRRDGAVAAGRSLVYTLPTSSGKTLVAELALLRCALVAGKKALFVLPFVSLVVEKVAAIEVLASRVGLRAEAFYGSQGSLPPAPGPGIAVATIEKANSYANALDAEGRLAELGLVVVDELHMVGEPDRGRVLEALLAKLLAHSDRCREAGAEGLQLVGMSATMPNASALGAWLRAETYEGKFRPVPLREHTVLKCSVLDSAGNVLRRLPSVHKDDSEGVCALVAEAAPQHSVLIFCPTKQQAETCAKHVAACLPALRECGPDVVAARKALLERLAESGDPDATLQRTIPSGVAFHNAGLTAEERALIEDAFHKRTICVLASTSTLAAGVNLPARRVIIRSPYVGREFMNAKYYRQMVGRAGRAGFDTFGESFLILDERNKKQGMQLLGSTMQIASVLGDPGWRRLVLEAVCSGHATTREQIDKLQRYTLAGTLGQELSTAAAIEELTRLRMIAETKGPRDKENAGAEGDEPAPQQQQFEATPLGDATYRSSMTPEEALVVQSELEKARRSLVLTDELHLCYLVTPIFGMPSPDWKTFLQKVLTLNPDQERIMELVGAPRVLVRDRAVGISRQAGTDGERAATRFFFALILLDLIHERSTTEVCKTYGQPRGTVQSIMQTASAFAGMMVSFCKRLGWWDLETLLSTYVKRLNWGVKPDILPLTEVKGIGRTRARALWNSGFRTVKAIAAAKPEELVKHVNFGRFPERVAKMIIRCSKELLEREARKLQLEVEEVKRGAEEQDTGEAEASLDVDIEEGDSLSSFDLIAEL